MKKSIGIDVKKPKKKCEDARCPFHGTLSVRGRIFVGVVKSAKAQKSAVVAWERQFYLKKYERYEKRLSKVQVHVPGCIEVNDKDTVKIAECRPLSKTKRFVVVENESN
ncbi:MAG: 30S ribosomal protein S17 [Nanoarchaeota archaeon]|nr:30S ribosomal protein S17 [Nanoarchaeota archaeon]|tara:strand:+ start:327 stop:653 length:327 start_codon:yes stop_codon:yes gene_type:complete